MEKTSLIKFLLHLADNTLILSQRNSEWCGHGPVLEQDIAITNISLDLLGQARNLYSYSATLIGGDATEDSLAYIRKEREFKNCLLVEQPNGDWAQTILRQYCFSQYQYSLYQQLLNSKDIQVAAIVEKSIREVAYHLRWSSEWVIRLGNGTEESHRRMLKAIEELWSYTGEMFIPAGYENDLVKENMGADLDKIKQEWQTKTEAIFAEATLPMPKNVFMQTGGKEGVHSEYLGFILTELQYMQRAYPGAKW